MALLVKKGTLVGELASGNKAYTGVGFQPKAVIFWATGQTTSGYAATASHSYGFGVSSTQRACISATATDNVAAAQCQKSLRPSVVCTIVAGTSPVIDSEADLVSQDADGFTLFWSSGGTALIVHYLALGGSDITNAYVGETTVPAGTGNTAVTGVGFQPDVVLLATPALALAGSGIGVNASIGIGAAVSPAQQGVSYAKSLDAANPTNDAVYQRTDRCLLTMNSSTGAVTGEGNFVSQDADGFTINWTTVGSGARIPYLCLKGGRYSVFNETQRTSTGMKAKTGLGSPTGLLLFGVNAAANAAVDATLYKLSVGGTDGVAVGATWVADTDNITPSDANMRNVTSVVFSHSTNPSTTGAEATLTSLDADGFTLDWTTADAVAREIIGVAFGSQPSAPAVKFNPLPFIPQGKAA